MSFGTPSDDKSDSTMEDPILHRPTLRRWFVFLGLAGGSVLVFGGIYFAVLFPVVVSLILAYLFLPIVRLIERLRVRRVTAVLIFVTALAAIGSLTISQLIPLVREQVLAIVRLAPQAFDQLVSTWLPGLKALIIKYHIANESQIGDALDRSTLMDAWSGQLQAFASNILLSTPSLFSRLVDLSLIMILTFFFMWEERQIKDGMRRLIPVDMIEPVLAFVARSDKVLKAVIKGQIMVALIDGLLYVVGLSLVGLQAAVTIGVVAGVCRLIPYLDVIVGGVMSMIVLAYTASGWQSFAGVLAVFAIVQTVDGLLITPRVIGDRVGLHPLVVILSVLAFSYWFGFYGVILAIPLTALGKVIIDMFLPYYLDSRAYDPSGRAGKIVISSDEQGRGT